MVDISYITSHHDERVGGKRRRPMYHSTVSSSVQNF